MAEMWYAVLCARELKWNKIEGVFSSDKFNTSNYCCYYFWKKVSVLNNEKFCVKLFHQKHSLTIFYFWIRLILTMLVSKKVHWYIHSKRPRRKKMLCYLITQSFTRILIVLKFFERFHLLPNLSQIFHFKTKYDVHLFEYSISLNRILFISSLSETLKYLWNVYNLREKKPNVAIVAHKYGVKRLLLLM